MRSKSSRTFILVMLVFSNFSSEGSLCLPRHWHKKIPTVVDRLVNGQFKLVLLYMQSISLELWPQFTLRFLLYWIEMPSTALGFLTPFTKRCARPILVFELCSLYHLHYWNVHSRSELLGLSLHCFRRRFRHRIRLLVSTPPTQLRSLDTITPRIFEQHSLHLCPSDEDSGGESPVSALSPAYLLPVRALNDVFISTCLSARLVCLLVKRKRGRRRN